MVKTNILKSTGVSPNLAHSSLSKVYEINSTQNVSVGQYTRASLQSLALEEIRRTVYHGILV